MQQSRTATNRTVEQLPGQPILLKLPDAAALLSIGKTKLYELIARGEIDTIQIDRSRRVEFDEIHRFIAARRSASP